MAIKIGENLVEKVIIEGDLFSDVVSPTVRQWMAQGMPIDDDLLVEVCMARLKEKGRV